MKKLISLFTVISLVLSMVVMGALSVSAAWDGTTVATAFASGTGTEADPYVIATPEQLAYLAQSVKNHETYEGKYFVLEHMGQNFPQVVIAIVNDLQTKLCRSKIEQGIK